VAGKTAAEEDQKIVKIPVQKRLLMGIVRKMLCFDLLKKLRNEAGLLWVEKGVFRNMILLQILGQGGIHMDPIVDQRLGSMEILSNTRRKENAAARTGVDGFSVQYQFYRGLKMQKGIDRVTVGP
jgi:hypothetical protein